MDNVVEEKSFRFAVRIVRLNQYLRTKKKEYVLSKQLLRSGTSIGANIAESQHAQSKADFISKLEIALKESSETDYWLELLYRKEKLSAQAYQALKNQCGTIRRKLIASVTTAKANAGAPPRAN